MTATMARKRYLWWAILVCSVGDAAVVVPGIATSRFPVVLWLPLTVVIVVNGARAALALWWERRR